MKLGVAIATLIGDFICGDSGSPFPYRSGRTITLFFTGLGHGYRIDDYSSRAKLAQNAMVEIDRQFGDEQSPLPSPEITAILEELMSPTAFERSNDCDFDAALGQLNRHLGRVNLQVAMVGDRPMVQSTDGLCVSTATASMSSVRRLVFSPSVFRIPDDPVPQDDLVSVMMPFATPFEAVFEAIRSTCMQANLRCFRVKDFWKESQIIQDIFELILASRFVIVDFTSGNTNVFYEAGIAHTLGKEVIPLAQSVKHDVPFDLQSHRVIEYLNNEQGLREMSVSLKARLDTLTKGHDWSSLM